jgi:hypothetical protein
MERLLLNLAPPRSLDRLVVRLLRERPGGLTQAWLFEDADARRSSEGLLAEAGVAARLHSAYKPLLCFFLEHVDPAGLIAADIVYPVHPSAHPVRFLSETYPLAALLPAVQVSFRPGGPALAYEVALHRDSGWETHRVPAPNRVRHGRLASCGWLQAPGQDGAPLETECEALFEAALAAVDRQGWRGEGPFFGRLTLTARLPAREWALGWGDEVLSLQEALHEELFFAVRERIGARPGQIVPEVTRGAPSLRITAAPLSPVPARPRPEEAVEAMRRPPSLKRVARELERLGELRLFGHSREGRAVPGLYKRGAGPAVLVSAAQHGNETSGVVGALRAARALLAAPDAHVAVLPVENVDGYALHLHLAGANPRHMHHAARYDAWGDDPGRRQDGASARALALSGARLHVNLHGYPAHEWTRPLSGYLPPGFEEWSLPKGFFLILAHHPHRRAEAEALLEAVAAELAQDPALVALNRRHLAARRAHVDQEPFTVRHDVACALSPSSASPAPLTLITEAPDETVLGDDFVLLHTAQMRAALAAVGAYARSCAA